MSSNKALLVLVMFLASMALITAEAATKDEKVDKNNDNLDKNGVDEGKYGPQGYGGPWGGGYRGPWGGGYGGPWGWRRGYCRFGCCGWGYYGGCRRCCFYPGEHLDVNVDAEPHN